MLFRELDPATRLAVAQPAHARISGQLAAAWGNARFPAPEPREDVVFTCGQHDLAWMGWEAAPEWDAETGWPRVFHAVGAARHAPLWAGAVAQALAAWGRWPALLISRHGSLIYTRFQERHRVSEEDAAAAATYLREQAALQERLAAALGAGPAEVAAASALLGVTDALSLRLCFGVGREAEPAGEALDAGGAAVPLTLRAPSGDPAEVVCDPWPFARDRVEVFCDARRLSGPFADAGAMRAALAAAPVETLRVTLRPA